MFGTVTFASTPFAAAGGNVFQAVVSELAQASDVLAAQADFAVSFSGAVTTTSTVGAAQIFVASTSEAASAAATTSSSYQIQSAVSELTAAAATPTALVTFGASTSATATAAATITSVPTYSTNISDAVTAFATTVTASQLHATTISETTTAADGITCIFVFPNFVDETVTATTTQTTQTVFPVSLSASAAAFAADATATTNFQVSVLETTQASLVALTAAVAFISTISENVTAVDETLSRFLWNDIDDDQSPGWTDILQPQILDDIATFGSANFGVIAFAGSIRALYNPLPAPWNEVDDSQDPGWTDIEAV